VKCPLCGSAVTDQHQLEFLVCAGCCEILRPNELVRRANRRTFRAYCMANFGQPTYPDDTPHRTPTRLRVPGKMDIPVQRGRTRAWRILTAIQTRRS
jgi:hypothetical protein